MFSVARPLSRYARASTRPSSEDVWRAIISSSLVGITHAETRLPGRENRGVFFALAAWSTSMPSHADERQMRLRISGRVLADAGGEDERVDAAQHGGEAADLTRRAVDEVVDGQPGGCLRARQQIAHVVADPRDPQQARFLVEDGLHVLGRQLEILEQVEDHAGIDGAGPGAHAESVECGESERAVDALPAPQRAHARAAAEVRDDHASGGDLRRHFRQDRGDVFVRQPVEPVALHTGRTDLARQRNERRDGG